MDNQEVIKAKITETFNDTQENVWVLELTDGGHYIQIFCDYEADEIWLECVSNTFLEEPFLLTNSQINKIIELGYSQPDDDNPNYVHEVFRFSDINRLANIFERTIVEIFEIPDVADVVLENRG